MPLPEVGNAAEVASDQERHLHMHAINMLAFDHATRTVLETLLELTRYIDSVKWSSLCWISCQTDLGHVKL
jgi:hypothetical protein